MRPHFNELTQVRELQKNVKIIGTKEIRSQVLRSVIP